MDTVRILRIVEYIGPRDWVEETIAGSIHGTRTIGTKGGKISASTIGSYPEIMQPSPMPRLLTALQAILPYAESRCEDLTEAKEDGNEDPTCPGADRAWQLLNEAVEAIKAAGGEVP